MKAGKFVAANQISEIYRNGLYPCFGGNGLRGFTESFTHNGLFPLIGRQGAHCGNVQLADGQFHATEHAVVVNADNNYNKMWLFYQLKRANLNQYATGQAQPGLSVDVINKVLITITSLPEQTKIAAFLSAVDTKIDQLTQKKALLETYKKGVMQQIFSQKIRFTPDEGGEYPEWEEKRLGEVANRKTLKNKENKYKYVLTNSATQGIVSQQDYFDKDIANQNNLEGYYIVDVDDFVYNPRISVFAPVGPIKRNKLAKGIMSPLYTVFAFNENVSLCFMEMFFSTNMWHDYMLSISNFGARHDRMNITTKDFIEMPILLPCLEEQTQIANFLSAIDRKIDLVSQQLEQTKAFKKGLLQQMFVWWPILILISWICLMSISMF